MTVEFHGGEGAGLGREGERTSFPPPTLVLLLSSTFVFLRSPFRANVHYAWNRLVHSELESFFHCRCKGSIDVHLGVFDILKAYTHAAAIPALALVKRHFFSIFHFAEEKSFRRFVFDDGVSSSIETS